jgi:hypothetical protein
MREETQCRIEPSFPLLPRPFLALRVVRLMPWLEDSTEVESTQEASITALMAEAMGAAAGDAAAGALALVPLP